MSSTPREKLARRVAKTVLGLRVYRNAHVRFAPGLYLIEGRWMLHLVKNDPQFHPVECCWRIQACP